MPCRLQNFCFVAFADRALVVQSSGFLSPLADWQLDPETQIPIPALGQDCTGRAAWDCLLVMLAVVGTQRLYLLAHQGCKMEALWFHHCFVC